MVSEKVKGKWVITDFKTHDKQKRYLIFYINKKDIFTRLEYECKENDLQNVLNYFSDDLTLEILDIYERKDIDFESEV